MYYLGLITTNESELAVEGYKRIVYHNTNILWWPTAICDWGNIKAIGISDSEDGEFLKIAQPLSIKSVHERDTYGVGQDWLAEVFNEFIKIESVQHVYLKTSLFPGGKR